MFQMPLDRISQVMSDQAGLGETGDSFLPGPDGLLRSDTHRDPEKYSVDNAFRHPGDTKRDLEVLDKAIGGEVGNGIFESYRGYEALMAYRPVDFVGLRWACIAEISADEAFAAVEEMETTAHRSR